MKKYIKKIFKFLFLIVQKKRKQNLHKFYVSKTESKTTKIDNKIQRIVNKSISDLQQDAKNFEQNIIIDDAVEQLTIEIEDNFNEKIQSNLSLQSNTDNEVITNTDIDEPESKNDDIATTDAEINELESKNDDIVTTEAEINELESKNDDIVTTDDEINELEIKNKVIDRKEIDTNYKESKVKNKFNNSEKKRKPSNIKLEKDINDMLQKIDIIFNNNKLIGNFDFNEEEYSELLEIVSLLCNFLCENGNVFDDKYHKLVFITLVEIVKRWKDFDNEHDTEEQSSFWSNISKHLTNDDTISQKLYNALTDVILQLGKKHIVPIVLIGQKFYSTLMMHSFAPKDSIFSFFELCYNIFKKDLDFGFTNEDEWLCEIVASQMKTVLSGGYRENMKVSIGSSVYSIKIGLKSFSENEELSIDFVQFIKGVFYNINKLFNRELVNENTRLERYIVEWWKNKIASEIVYDNTTRKRRVSTVTKDNIVAKYIRYEDIVFLNIPSIRLDNDDNIILLKIFENEKQILLQEIRTKRGELVIATKSIELNLNDLLRNIDTINLRVEIVENDIVIFNSERYKATSLKREFILFEGENEVLSQINKPTNYFVYSKNIDVLKRIPDELTTYGTYLYNIYPKAGDSLSGEIKQVFFIDKSKTASIGKTACLIGGELNVEWFFNDISCIVYSSGVKLLVPEDVNLKALELRIGCNAHKLNELNYERIESRCYQFGLKAIGLILDNQPTEINLYSYEKESMILTETIIVLPNLEIQFNHPFYYGDLERKLIVKNGDEALELTWSNQDNEIRCPINDGMLLIKIPYLKWRINDNEWQNEPINKKLWYKDFLVNGDILGIDNPKENDDITIFCKTNGKPFEIVKNQSGNFEIGRAIYANENITDISVYIVLGKDYFEIFTVSTKEHFITNPLSYSDGKVFWNVEDSFIGDKNTEFFLIIKSADNNFREKINFKNSEIKNLNDDLCKIQVKIKDKNIFSQAENYKLIYEGELLIGKPEKLRFKHKKITLLSANCFDSKKSEWIPFIPKYFIDKLKFVQEDENNYYTGQLCVIDKNGKTTVINTMINEKGIYDKTNPVRIELRDNSTLWLVAGWEGGNDFLGTLIYDTKDNVLCNINSNKNDRYKVANLYKFKEEDNV